MFPVRRMRRVILAGEIEEGICAGFMFGAAGSGERWKDGEE
jgi:hypothetical protein